MSGCTDFSKKFWTKTITFKLDFEQKGKSSCWDSREADPVILCRCKVASIQIPPWLGTCLKRLCISWYSCFYLCFYKWFLFVATLTLMWVFVDILIFIRICICFHPNSLARQYWAMSDPPSFFVFFVCISVFQKLICRCYLDFYFTLYFHVCWHLCLSLLTFLFVFVFVNIYIWGVWVVIIRRNIGGRLAGAEFI